MGRSFKDQSNIRKQPTEMRIKALIIIATISVQIFCQLPQQTLAITQDNQRVVRGDLDDSDSYFQAAIRAPKPARDNTGRVEDLLARMTLEEKIGQMTQLQIAMVTSGEDQNIHIDPAKLDKAVVKYGVGSILNVNNQALTVDKWREIIGQIQKASQKTRLKIPVLYGIDSIHGANYVQGATLHPQEIGMAAGRRHSLDLLASA